MSNTLILFIVGGIVFLMAGALELIMVVQGFKESVKKGILAIVAPSLLAIGLGCIFFASHLIAIESVGAKEVKEQGAKEAQKQIDELNNINPDEMQLDL